MLGVVLAGGYGKRLLPITKEKPKSFLELAGRQLLDYSVEVLRRGDAKKILIVVPRGFTGLVRCSYENVFVREQAGEGISGGIRTAVEFANKIDERQLLISYSGFLTNPPTISESLLEFYASSGFPLAIAVSPVSTGLETYGFVSLDYNGQIKGYMEAREPSRLWLRNRGYVFAGLMVGDIAQMERLSLGGFEESMMKLAEEGIMGGFIWNYPWIEVGYPWDLLDALRVVLKDAGIKISKRSTVSRSSIISNDVVIDDGAIVEEGATIVGPAYIGRNAIISAGSVIKPFTSIEENVTIGENSIVSSSLIMRNSSVAPLSEVRSSVVGENARIGPSVHIVEGVPKKLPERLKGLSEFLGENVMLGAIISPNKEVEPFKVVGNGEVIE
ncbi:MAG: NDP-sugar synthase [Caldisphaeraceae archaeon]|nr:NDP-sugar synthase [Caldisphaeraceae archaeon]MEB3797339.1 NDP-sugar synthase [Caldisphaeraceae archaeon]